MNDNEGQETPRSRNLLTLPVRFLLHWILKIIILVFLGVRFLLRPRPVRYGLAAILVLGVVGWKAAVGPLHATQTGSTAAPTTAVTTETATNQLPASPVVENYLQAQAAFDGKTMWGLLSDDMKTTMQASNASLQQLQTELDAAKQQGRHYKGATYVGGIPLDSDNKVYFYVLSVDTPNGSTQVPYIYVVGPDDKIVSIQ